MKPHGLRSLFLVSVLTVAGACETSKSSNPLSPSIAGPIPGVTITAPRLVEPAAGREIEAEEPPVTLVVENASTNGQRALLYVFEVATDAGFSTIVFSREGVTQGANGRTSLTLPERLASGRSYYWRARAYDGANTGPYASPVTFRVFTRAVLASPTPLRPAAGTTVSGRRPEFAVQNAVRSGPVDTVAYTFEISASQSLSPAVAVVTVAEQENETGFTLGQDLDLDRQYFWRVRAYDSSTASAWSETRTFKTPAVPTLGAPILLFPVGGVTVTTPRPAFRVLNSTRSGSIGTVTYTFQVATDPAFTSTFTTVTVQETTTDTGFTLGQTLAAGAQYFWRAQASDGTTLSPWSVIQFFWASAGTPAPTPTPTPTPPPSPTPAPTPTPTPPPGGDYPDNGPDVIEYVEDRWPERLAAGVSLSTRKDNMEFLRDRIIETGICGGMDLAWNLKRGGPERSIDFLAYRKNGVWIGVDIGYAYDDTSTPLHLQWAEAGASGTYPDTYTPRPSCQ